MLMSYGKISIIYFLVIITSFALAYLYGRHTKNFLWKEYIAMLAMPLIGVAGIIFWVGTSALYVFVFGVLIGPLLEWMMGFVYYKILGKRLWVYERYPLPGRHTSYLTIPIWGIGFLLLWLVSKSFL